MPREHIEPSTHSTDEVDEILKRRDETADQMGAEPPSIKPNTDLDEEGNPVNVPRNPRI
jgi:hypothetical protein